MEVSKERTVIAGRYELESLIGEGGMGSVWRARDLTLARPVALKLLFGRDIRDQSNMVKRFLREARIAASVQHRNVIHIVDFGTTGPGQPFMVMELLRGETLNQRLDRDPPLDVATFVNIIGMTLRGLGAVHEAGIVHRDLKPDNIFLTSQDAGTFPKILDFGISRSVGPASGRRSALTTKEGLIVGTPEYMSPEQARGIRGIDHRTDLYSVGVMLFEGLTGELPFASENVGDLIIQIVTGTPRRVDKLNPSCPKALADVIEHAMAHNPDDRYQSAQEMQDALLHAAGMGVLAGATRPLSERPSHERQQALMQRELTETSHTTEALDLDLSAEEMTTPPPLPAHPAPAARPAGPAAPPPATPPRPAGKPSVPFHGPPLDRGRPAQRGSAALLATVGTLMLAGVAVGAPMLWPNQKTPVVTALPDTRIEARLAPPEATIELVGLPRGATVTIDGVTHAGGALQLPRDGKPRLIAVHAEGMRPWETSYLAQGDDRLEVALEPDKPRRRQRRSARPTRRTRPRSEARRVKKPAPAPARAPRAPPRALRNLDF